MLKRCKTPLWGLLVAAALLALPVSLLAAQTFTFGLLMVGPYNDQGWSQAHYAAGKVIEKKIPGTQMIYIDKVNPADRPGVTISQLVDDMVAKGAKLIITNSDDMKDGTREAAKNHPKVYFINVTGDDVLTGKATPNVSNIMGRMEVTKMMAGVAAAMTTKTGKIGYLGPLINEETRRLAASCFLGARYAWEHVLKKNPADLKFKVTWIGFWFNIPGVTSDPTLVAENFFNSGYDVVVSGLDTPEALTVANQKHKQGQAVWAMPYVFEGACQGADAVCLGIPYFNWVPLYTELISAAMSGKWTSRWEWRGPDWKDITNPETSSVGFKPGPALSAEAKKAVDRFAADMAAGKVNLFKGPLWYQDGSVFVKEGETATDKQVWYMEQLLKGMEGASSAK